MSEVDKLWSLFQCWRAEVEDLQQQLQEKDKRIAELERRVAGIDENAVYRASAVFTDEPD